MSVGIMFFADHDLPMPSADDFIKEFSQRSHSNIVLTDDFGIVPDYTKVQISANTKNTWYFSYCSKMVTLIKFFHKLTETSGCSIQMVKLKCNSNYLKKLLK